MLKKELHEPETIVAVILILIGTVGMFSLLFDFPDWIPLAGFVLFLSGIYILARKKRENMKHPN